MCIRDSPGAVEAAQLFQASANAAGIPLEIKLEPDDGYWSNVWNVAPFCASYWGGRPVQDQMYSTAYLSTAEWNDTAFKDPHFDELLIAARGELDQAKRKAMYSEMAYIVRDTGGLICPMSVSYTHLDVYKRQPLLPPRESLIFLQHVQVHVVSHIAVSYTHLDVYKRQRPILASGGPSGPSVIPIQC